MSSKSIKKHLFQSALSVFLILSAAQTALAGDAIPKGWIKAGSTPQNYEIQTDPQTHDQSQRKSVTIKGLPKANDGFTTMMQTIQAKKYLGKRVRLSGYIKSEKLEGWAGLWMRVDGPKGENLKFDNMYKRKITGNISWKKYSVVLDIPQNSEYIAFGILSSGQGQIWIDQMQFDIVGKDIPSTDMLTQKKEQPENLGFN